MREDGREPGPSIERAIMPTKFIGWLNMDVVEYAEAREEYTSLGMVVPVCTLTAELLFSRQSNLTTARLHHTFTKRTHYFVGNYLSAENLERLCRALAASTPSLVSASAHHPK